MIMFEAIHRVAQGMMNFLLVTELQQRLCAPAKVPSPELRKVMRRSLKKTAIPAVVNGEFTNVLRCAEVAMRFNFVLQALKKDSSSLSNIMQR